jgi:hypothetical protein
MVLFFEISKPLQKKFKVNSSDICACATWLYFRLGVFKVPFDMIYVGTGLEKYLRQKENIGS